MLTIRAPRPALLPKETRLLGFAEDHAVIRHAYGNQCQATMRSFMGRYSIIGRLAVCHWLKFNQPRHLTRPRLRVGAKTTERIRRVSADVAESTWHTGWVKPVPTAPWSLEVIVDVWFVRKSIVMGNGCQKHLNANDKVLWKTHTSNISVSPYRTHTTHILPSALTFELQSINFNQ